MPGGQPGRGRPRDGEHGRRLRRDGDPAARVGAGAGRPRRSAEAEATRADAHHRAGRARAVHRGRAAGGRRPVDRPAAAAGSPLPVGQSGCAQSGWSSSRSGSTSSGDRPSRSATASTTTSCTRSSRARAPRRPGLDRPAVHDDPGRPVRGWPGSARDSGTSSAVRGRHVLDDDLDAPAARRPSGGTRRSTRPAPARRTARPGCEQPAARRAAAARAARGRAGPGAAGGAVDGRSRREPRQRRAGRRRLNARRCASGARSLPFAREPCPSLLPHRVRTTRRRHAHLRLRRLHRRARPAGDLRRAALLRPVRRPLASGSPPRAAGRSCAWRRTRPTSGRAATTSRRSPTPSARPPGRPRRRRPSRSRSAGAATCGCCAAPTSPTQPVRADVRFAPDTPEGQGIRGLRRCNP